MEETIKLKKEIKELQDRITKMEGILWGLNDDNVYKTKTRKTIIVGEHTTGKPTIVGPNGKKYNLQTV